LVLSDWVLRVLHMSGLCLEPVLNPHLSGQVLLYYVFCLLLSHYMEWNGLYCHLVTSTSEIGHQPAHTNTI